MNLSIQYRLFSFLLLSLLAVRSSYGQDSSKVNLVYDHIVLFVENETLMDSLNQLFTPAEKLTTKHINQGTIGYYYLFYNTYIEILFLTDSINAHQNKDQFGSDYVSRWAKGEDNCPIGFGMIMSPRDTSSVPAGFHKYQSNDAPAGEYYLMSEYNDHLNQPLVYVSMPNRAYKAMKTLDEIDDRQEEIRDDLRKYLTHRSNIKNLTLITYSHVYNYETAENMNLLSDQPNIQFKSSDSNSLTLVFDNKKEVRKEFELNDNTTLVILY